MVAGDEQLHHTASVSTSGLVAGGAEPMEGGMSDVNRDVPSLLFVSMRASTSSLDRFSLCFCTKKASFMCTAVLSLRKWTSAVFLACASSARIGISRGSAELNN